MGGRRVFDPRMCFNPNVARKFLDKWTGECSMQRPKEDYWEKRYKTLEKTLVVNNFEVFAAKKRRQWES